MKRPHFIWHILICLILISQNTLHSQNELKAKFDSLQSVIDRTIAQDSIKELLSRQLELAKDLDDLPLQASLEMQIGNYSNYEGFEKETHNLNALAIYKSLKDTSGIIDAYYALSNAKQNQNDYDSTRVYANKLIELAESISDTKSIIKGRLMLSSLYNHLSLYAKSLEELNKSRILAEKIEGDETLLLDILNKESFTYYSLGEYDKSAIRIKQIIELFKEENNARRLNLWLNNLASVYSLCNNCVSYRERKDILRESIEYSEVANFTYGKAFAYKHLADVYRDEGIQDSAIHYLNRIEKLLPEINKKDFTALVSVSQGAYWGKEGDNDKAIAYFKKAYDIWEEIGSKKDQLDMAWNLGNRHADRGEFRTAFNYLKTYISLKDTLYNADNIRKINELELSYDFRQKQITDSLKNEERLKVLEVGYQYEAAIQRRSLFILIIVVVAILIIAILIFNNYKKQKYLAEKLKIKSAQVESELNQKQLLLTEIHHRVKNNFQILSSLLELQAKGTNDPTTRHLITEGKSRVKSMALIHGQLYNSDSLKMKLADYLEKLVLEIQKSFEKPNSKVKINIGKDFEVDIDNMVPLGLIANELITNSFKYAAQESLQLDISLDKSEDYLVLKFNDNGPGLPPTFSLENSKSTGLWLVSRLALQLHGRYEYSMNKGAEFRIYFTQSNFIQS